MEESQQVKVDEAVRAKRIGDALKAPFPLAKLGFKPQTVAKDGLRALAVAYIDARDVMDRLDDAVGADGWQDDYTLLPGGQWLCKLSVRFGEAWVTKCDVGGESDQADKGDKCKAAVSDALKRAAVKFGVGRYLYSMPNVWHEFDPQKKQFKGTPPVPASFLPPPERPQRPAPAQPQSPPPAAAAKSEPAKPAPDFFGFLDLIATADSLTALAAVWEDVNAAYKAKLLAKEQYDELSKAKEARKAALSAPKK